MTSLKVTGALTLALSTALVLSACGGQARTAAVGEDEGGTETASGSLRSSASRFMVPVGRSSRYCWYSVETGASPSSRTESPTNCLNMASVTRWCSRPRGVTTIM